MLVLIIPRLAAAADQTLLLSVQLNGYVTDKIGTFVLRDGALLARGSELTDLGLRVPVTTVAGPDGLIALADLPGFTWHFDSASQTLSVAADDEHLLPTSLHVGRAPLGGGVIESGTGATLNYDINGSSAADQNVGSGVFDARVFTPWGIASTDALGYVGGGPDGPGTSTAIRLDSTYTFSDPDTQRRYRLGDFITGGLNWTRPIRLGGIQLTSDFTMRPDLVTYPLPIVIGSVAVPSTLDVMANGTKLFSQEIQAGPFEIPQLPMVSGASMISMTTTNAVGHQVTVTLPFYASSTLLASGLQTYSAQVGKVRTNWGAVSNDYGGLAGSANYRRGVAPWLTVEANAEASAGFATTGGGVVVNLFNQALLNAAAAASGGGAGGGGGGGGTQFSLGLQRIGTVFSFGVAATAASPNYRDIAALNNDLVPRLQLSASAGMSLGSLGSVGAAYTKIDRAVAPSPIKLYLPPGSQLPPNATVTGGAVLFQPDQRSQIFSASYSVQVGNVSLYATAYRDFANTKSNGILVGLTIPFGTRSSGGVSTSGGSNGGAEQVQAQQSPVQIGDWGYQVYASNGSPSHEFGQAQYKSPWAEFTGGVDRLGQASSKHVEAQGAVSFVDGAIFPSNTVQDSFGVVDTSGLANVRVLSENREAGRTDSAGQLLVPDLRAFDVNHIAIDPTDIPSDSAIDVIERDVRPQDRSGIVVRFPVRVSRGALLRLVDADGIPLPVGSTATLRATGVTVPVGYDGDAYVENLSPHNDVAVEYLNGRRCTVAFDYSPVPGQIPSIGPLRCADRWP